MSESGLAFFFLHVSTNANLTSNGRDNAAPAASQEEEHAAPRPTPGGPE
jgi:hypothetical protein